MNATRKCSIDECKRTHLARGLCSMHYQRARSRGDLAGSSQVKYASPAESFAARTERQGDCLIWTGTKNAAGYGSIWVMGRMVLTHRYSWERANGPIPEGMEIDHICHNRACASPGHLRAVSRSQNNSNRAGAMPGSLSGARNVSPNRSKWEVQIGKNGTRHYFGTYDTIEEAAAVAEHARKELFGEFAGKG